MRLDIYQKETEQVTHKQVSILNIAREKMKKGEKLNPIEENGVLHALQILIENAIGKAKHILKSIDIAVPISGYESFEELINQNRIAHKDSNEWNGIIGLRNKIVHDYMNIDFEMINEIIEKQRYQIVVDFLLEPIE
ncbi:DUF86 domain-containing protein [bacterium]|nr:DUF86 domain-containing protein [bacterium]